MTQVCRASARSRPARWRLRSWWSADLRIAYTRWSIATHEVPEDGLR